MAHGTSAREVVEALKDVDFPATKDELVEAARRTGGGSKEVVAALRAIPPTSTRTRTRWHGRYGWTPPPTST